MNYPHRSQGPAPLPSVRPDNLKPWTVTPAGSLSPRPPRGAALTRRYELAWLDASGELHESTRIAPAIPAFETAFCAFARGALLSTPNGPVAVEDLVPGMPVSTREGAVPLRWIGRILLPPQNLRQDSGPDIYRIAADSFGGHRPSPDLVLGSAARLLRRTGQFAAGTAASEALVPISDFADGISVMQLSPMSSVQTCHLFLDRHAVVEVNGVPVETYHPGREVAEALSGDLMRLFLSFFPFVGDLGGFGHAVAPRMGLEQFQSISAA